MSVEKVTFKMGGLLQVLPDLDTVNGRVFPISPNADVPNTALSCHENLVNYQVPVGKKALVIGVQAFDGSTARPVRIFYNPSADTTNGSDVDITTIYTLGTAAQMPAPSEFAVVMYQYRQVNLLLAFPQLVRVGVSLLCGC